ncbi:MAG: type III pantothenate kinase [Pseudomonadales bacterium]
MILECDIGNTCCKWRLLDRASTIVSGGSFAHEEGFAGLPSLGRIERIRVASVAKNVVVEQFLAKVGESGIEPEFAISSKSAAGVTNAYGEDAVKLGIDRWLAVVAAYNRQRGAVLVIDVGTALKADLVAADGRHLGGYIVPGTDLMKSSLKSATAKVRFSEKNYVSGVVFGRCTTDAVHAGVLASQVGAITVAISEAKRQMLGGFAILLTGGGASNIAAYLETEVVGVPDLVLDGLGWLLP